MGVRTEGLYTVTAAEVATATGLSSGAVLASFQATNLLVTCQGEPVPCSVDNDQLSFYGVPAFSKRAPENVYWLQLDTGAMPPLLPPVSPPTNDWAMGTLTVQGTNDVSYPMKGTLVDLPSFLAFNLIAGGKDFSVTNSWPDGVTNAVPGEITVTLLSLSSGETSLPDSHSAGVSVNGTVVGTPAWDNELYQAYTYTVPGELLTNGVAVVRVENLLPAANTARFFWTKLALTVPRRTDVQAPVCYPSLRGVCDLDGFAADNQADYVALIPPEGWIDGFRETLQPLIDFRAKQGLRTAVIDVEALYNRFTYGLADPEAIRAFCSLVSAGPDVRLKYLLLAGSGSLDYAHEKFTVSAYNPCLIPPPLASQRFQTGEAMIVPVDQAFGDLSGNSAPEIAVGRFPTARTQELAVAVSKTLAYEASAQWKTVAALSADWNFASDMNRVGSELVAAGKMVSTFYPANAYGLPAVWNNGLKPALQQGAGVFWYIGHSSTTSLGKDSVLMNNNTIKTVGWTNKPIAMLMGCFINTWQAMNITIPDAMSLGPFSVFRQESGFSAVFASTGYVSDGAVGPSGEAQTLAVYLAEASASNGLFRLGDAICSALQRLAVYDPLPDPLTPYDDPEPITAERLQSYSLVGDPALTWRHDYSGTGTPVSWLQTYGLTAWDGDVSDTDGDGWKAWQEYQAGTRPDTNRLHIVRQTVDTASGSMDLAFETEANKRYRVLWKYALEDPEPWAPISWALSGQIQTLRSPEEFIIPAAALTTICVPVHAEDKQGFYRVQQVD